MLSIPIMSDDDVRFQEICDKYYKYAFSICNGWVNQYQDAEEILNTVFAKVYQYADLSQPDIVIKSFILKVLRNDTNNYLKHKYRKPDETEYFEEINISESEWANAPLEKMVKEERHDEICEEIHKLSSKIAETMELHLLQRLSKREVARVLDIPVKTVYSRIDKGKKQLQKRLIEKKIVDIN